MSSTNAESVSPSYRSAALELRGNVGQWDAYQSKGHCVVLAGPGSGKTKTLTVKLARMLMEDVSLPRGIACVTFSSECVRELTRRLDALGVGEAPNLFIGTVHSFCLSQILSPFGALGGLALPQPIRVASPAEQDTLYAEAHDSIIANGRRVRRNEADWYRRTYLDRTGPDWLLDENPVFNVIEEYERQLRLRNLIDFDDMMLLGLRLVESQPWVRQALRAKFPILVVDEYQDLGVPLHRLVMSLCLGSGMRLFAVGDPDQSIYGFTGSKPELLRVLSDHPDVECVQLKMNYRCATSIIRASEIVLCTEQGRFAALSDSPGGLVELHEYPDGIEDQAQKICGEIVPYCLEREPGRTLGDIAVLYLDKNDGDLIADAASHAGIEYTRIDGNAPYQRTALTRWLEDCAAWCCGGWRLGDPRLSSLIRTWIRLNGYLGCVESIDVALRRQLVHFLWRHRGGSQRLAAWLGEIKTECLDRCFSSGCTQSHDYEQLRRLVDAAAPNGAMEESTLGMFAGQGGSPDHLNLVTLHSAKGREFDAVIMMGMDEGRIPWTNDDASKIAEKRRLFYVGVTRARREVHLTYSGWYHDRFRGRTPRGASRFVVELRNRLT